MNPHRWALAAVLLAAIAWPPTGAGAAGLDVEVWTDRGSGAVYDPGEVLEVQARTSGDAFLLVYELDAEGFVRLLFPYHGNNGLVPGGQVLALPDERSNLELVVQEPVGQAYLVAIASREPFGELPWYLRPYDAQAEQLGYEGEADEEEGITAEGRIVGDPFVAMERIRRRVLAAPDDPDAFATSYTTYYVHEEVKYPRYLCYDCHRPGQWQWWTGFDPYYTTCNVFEFRVNYAWYWGPRYWFGYVPYYWYVPRHDCAPAYHAYARYSPWGGWTRWKTLWGSSLTRYKTAPPPGYIAPPKIADRRRWGDGATPPGLVAAGRGTAGIGTRLPIGRRTTPGRTPLPAHDPNRGRDPVWRGDDTAENGGGRVARAPRFERRGTAAVPRGEGIRRGTAAMPRGEGIRRDARGIGRIARPVYDGRRGRSAERPDPGQRSAPPPRIDRTPMERIAPRIEERIAPRIERGPERVAPPRESGRVEHARRADPPPADRGSFQRPPASDTRGSAPVHRGGHSGDGGAQKSGRGR